MLSMNLKHRSYDQRTGANNRRSKHRVFCNAPVNKTVLAKDLTTSTLPVLPAPLDPVPPLVPPPASPLPLDPDVLFVYPSVPVASEPDAVELVLELIERVPEEVMEEDPELVRETDVWDAEREP